MGVVLFEGRAGAGGGWAGASWNVGRGGRNGPGFAVCPCFRRKNEGTCCLIFFDVF